MIITLKNLETKKTRQFHVNMPLKAITFLTFISVQVCYCIDIMSFRVVSSFSERALKIYIRRNGKEWE